MLALHLAISGLIVSTACWPLPWLERGGLWVAFGIAALWVAFDGCMMSPKTADGERVPEVRDCVQRALGVSTGTAEHLMTATMVLVPTVIAARAFRSCKLSVY